jgi:micrococcal nuclease
MLSHRRTGWWTGLLLVAAVVVLLVRGAERGGNDAASGPGGAAPGKSVEARVTGVTDGDTIDVEIDGEQEDVRYIGIDTPESTSGQPLECFGHEAAAENERLVGGAVVTLTFGPELRDRYDRLLAYVRRDGLFINAELVRRGFARSLTISPNDQFAELFERLEGRAGRAARGLWGDCAE